MKRPQARRRRMVAAALAFGGLAGYVLLVYVVVVLGGGAVVGRTDSPGLALSVVATAIVALSFERVNGHLTRWSYTAMHAGGATPYDQLRSFSRLVGHGAGKDVPPQMAQLLGQGTGAAWVQVWLSVPGRLTLAAAWPEGTTPAHAAMRDLKSVESEARATPGRRHQRVYQAGELMGLILLQERDGVPLTSTEERLLAELADQAGVVLRGQRLRAQLEQRREELAARVHELRASRQRLVETQDAARRRLERDIHDGAQQHLVALAVSLRLAHQTAARSPARSAEQLAAQVGAVRETIDTLLDLTRGIYPRRLVEHGVPAALRAAAERSPLPVVVIEESVGRYPADVEAAAYFCCMEALQNAAKHSGGSQVRLSVTRRHEALVCAVEDDGTAPAAGREPGAGLVNMRDRVDAVGGVLTISSPPGGGTRVEILIPLDPARGY